MVDVGEHSVDAVLFLLHHGQADRIGVVGLQQAELFVFEAFLLPGQVAVLGLGLGVDAVEDVLDHPSERVGGFGREIDGVVVLRDQLLHSGDEHGLPLAVRDACVAADHRVDSALRGS